MYSKHCKNYILNRLDLPRYYFQISKTFLHIPTKYNIGNIGLQAARPYHSHGITYLFLQSSQK
jgi:hypothetical protein